MSNESISTYTLFPTRQTFINNKCIAHHKIEIMNLSPICLLYQTTLKNTLINLQFQMLLDCNSTRERTIYSSFQSINYHKFNMIHVNPLHSFYCSLKNCFPSQHTTILHFATRAYILCLLSSRIL